LNKEITFLRKVNSKARKILVKLNIEIKEKINMPNKNLLNFIVKARKRGYSDLQIKKILLKNNWTRNKIDSAFAFLNPKFKSKNQICIYLNTEILEKLKKRAKKNMFTIPEQIENILRRSCVRSKTSVRKEKIDDLLVKCFSRSNRGRKKKK